MHRRAGALALLLLAAGCGGGSTLTAGSGTEATKASGSPAAPATSATVPGPATSGPATSAPSAAGPPDRSASVLPSVEMSDVTRGTTVDLASLIPAPRPVLLWFWAPH